MWIEDIKEIKKEVFEGDDISKSLEKLKNNISNWTQLNIFKGMVDIQNNQEIKNKATGFMTTLWDLLKIDVPLLWSVGELFETKRPVDILGNKKNRKNNKFINGIFKIFGMPDGIEGLHKNYIQEQVNQIDKIDNNFTKEAFSLFSKEASPVVSEENTLRKKYNLEDFLKDKKEEERLQIKEKIPSDDKKIKEVLINTLPKYIDKININTVKKTGNEYIFIKDGQEFIDQEKIKNDIPAFVDKYISTIIPLLATSGDEFITSVYVSKDTFTLAIFGNIIGEKFFVEWINLGIIKKEDYLGTLTASQIITPKIEETGEKKDNNKEINQKITSELWSVQDCPLTADMVINAANSYNVPVEYILAIMKNDSHYGTLWIGKNTHNPGNVGNTDDGSTKDRWTREAGVNAVAENLAQRITGYQKVYGTANFPAIKQLADNQWSDGKGFLEKQGNYKKDNPQRLGAYMTAKWGGNAVNEISNNLRTNWISQEKLLA